VIKINNTNTLVRHHKVVCKCGNGFELLPGRLSIHHLNKQSWSITILLLFLDERECGRPPSIAHAHYDKNDTGDEWFPLGSMVKYRCDPGFTTSPDPVLRAWCVRGGHWIGPTLTCTREITSRTLYPSYKKYMFLFYILEQSHLMSTCPLIRHVWTISPKCVQHK